MPNFLRTGWWPVQVAILFATGLPGPAVAAQPDVSSVELRSFVNWNYRERSKLGAWMSTARVLAKTLELWHPRGFSSEVRSNGNPAALSRFFSDLPGEQKCGISMVFLASHQSRDLRLHFTQGESADWEMLLGGVSVPFHPRRLVILDACFAAGVQGSAIWHEKLPGLWLFACSPSEEVFELSVRRHRPIDLRKRYPDATRWLETTLGSDWDGRISFTGFVWTCAFLETLSPPQSPEAWKAFFDRCGTIAADIDALGARRFASRISHVDAR